MDTLRMLLRAGRHDEAWCALRAAARVADDYPTVQALCRVRRQLAERASAPPQPATVRLALLSGATTALLEEPLRLALDALGVDVTLHVPPYGTYVREMLEPSSGTVAFRPAVAIVVATTAELPAWPSWSASAAEVEAAVEAVCEHWLGLCRALRAHADCDIVLPTFPDPPVRPLGAAGVRLPGEPGRFVRAVNAALARRAPSYVHLHDVAALAAFHGVGRWMDARYWYQARQPVSFDCLVPYVRSLAQLVAALFGRAAKCVVTDLDNTLWGGVVGDDGVDRLALGEGDPRGEAFVAFQRYLLRLRERGIMLAVASKNDETAALAPFASRREMVLRRDDFVAFRANWQPKSENVRDIAATLGIGLDAVVYVDDNPAEREQVRQALPEVRVVELGDDPSDYPVQVDRTGWLETVSLSAEDRARSGMYAANARREELRAGLEDYDAYLRSLRQRAVITPFEARHLERIHQLTNKTNQFNLTTRRLSASQLAAMIDSSGHLTATVRLADRFGDNGLVSVFAAHAEDGELWIDLWLMSCRVLKRGVEQLLCNHVVQRARAAGYRTLHGTYVPTARNGLVRDHYPSLGFARGGPVAEGEHWVLALDAARPIPTSIALVDDDAGLRLEAVHD
ncbi:MAG TPA: HAD-IIIC family phosphatase [Gemmatimonadaceae bacterium]|nr:HAD-IIIC family phosphatase [Gemmatimonadaceae bacterium]